MGNAIEHTGKDHLKAATWIHRRGDPKQPGKTTQIAPAVPAFLSAFSEPVREVELPLVAFAPGSQHAVQTDKRNEALSKLEKARQQLEKTRRSKPPKRQSKELGETFAPVTENFSQLNEKIWELTEGCLKIRNGALHQEMRRDLPAS